MSGPAGRIGPFRLGAALIALRTGAPIVPLAIAGTEELYIGRRMASRDPAADERRASCSATTGTATLPPEGSRAELELARRADGALRGACSARTSRRSTRATVDPPGHPRRLRKRLTWLLLRPGRLDRDEA